MRIGRMLVIFEDGGSELKTAFDKFDRNSDGYLGVAELHAGLKLLGAAFSSATRADVEKIVSDAFDKDPAENPRILFDEFAAFVARARAQLAAEGPPKGSEVVV